MQLLGPGEPHRGVGRGTRTLVLRHGSSCSALAPTLTPRLGGLGLMMKCSEPGSIG